MLSGACGFTMVVGPGWPGRDSSHRGGVAGRAGPAFRRSLRDGFAEEMVVVDVASPAHCCAR